MFVMFSVVLMIVTFCSGAAIAPRYVSSPKRETGTNVYDPGPIS